MVVEEEMIWSGGGSWWWMRSWDRMRRVGYIVHQSLLEYVNLRLDGQRTGL